MGGYQIRSAGAEIELPTGVNMFKNPGDAGASPVFLSPRLTPCHIARCDFSQWSQV